MPHLVITLSVPEYYVLTVLYFGAWIFFETLFKWNKRGTSDFEGRTWKYVLGLFIRNSGMDQKSRCSTKEVCDLNNVVPFWANWTDLADLSVYLWYF